MVEQLANESCGLRTLLKINAVNVFPPDGGLQTHGQSTTLGQGKNIQADFQQAAWVELTEEGGKKVGPREGGGRISPSPGWEEGRGPPTPPLSRKKNIRGEEWGIPPTSPPSSSVTFSYKPGVGV